jgi:hypothetical protein
MQVTANGKSIIAMVSLPNLLTFLFLSLIDLFFSCADIP